MSIRAYSKDEKFEILKVCEAGHYSIIFIFKYYFIYIF
ncbi:hypothetical protein ERICI_01373 [Paenibacillus larvae subsp. larvae]|uniref:Transposase n=1 Tax=Paenibacillus larvae subsp. larvae TaxID=147375 RepID=A0A6C0QXP9_9BACL|nr:hypothetical protein ERICI_01373 [Paenibacillus larvae subsp. larvae]ETK25792.1 hypothetical protein ERIC1_3c01150 [Paenibacillus larvae subsp. larvae DSM 25719]ETK30059.1 hypothetical protein ERIC1_1c36180 [Paenibacillus larvae subsp. larvae DSM 25719]QHZ52986.1 hypothetical protein ERICV_03892 [Paenibacillus larvae subsp. larvae]